MKGYITKEQLSDSLKNEFDHKVNIYDLAVNIKNFGAKGDGVTNDTQAILNALNFAYNNNQNLYIPQGIYMVDNEFTEKEDWEVFTPVFKLQDKPITIFGDGYLSVLKKIKNNNNAVSMFRTSLESTSKIILKDFKIEGNMNAGSVGNLIDGITLNGCKNVVCENIFIDKTKRHGFYIIHNAQGNEIISPKIRNTSREMSGCGIQFEGASYNIIKNVDIRKTGSNAIDFNTWFTSLYYPEGTYQASESFNSIGNEVIGGVLLDIALENQTEGGGSATNFVDDDYYAINIINNSSFNKINIDLIENVRIVDDPAKCTYQSAIRLYNCFQNEVFVKNLKNIKKYGCRLGENTTLNTVIVDNCKHLEKIIDIDLGTKGNIQDNDIRIFSTNNKQNASMSKGCDFKYISNSENSTGTDYITDILMGWGVSWGTNIDLLSEGVLKVTHSSTRKFITKEMNFTNPYVIIKLKYRTNSPTATIGITDNTIYHEHKVGKTLVADEITHTLNIILPYLNSNQVFRISANNSETANNSAYIEISEFEIFDHNGNRLNSNSDFGKLREQPTVGIYEKGDVVYNTQPSADGANGWICIESGSPGIWKSF